MWGFVVTWSEEWTCVSQSRFLGRELLSKCAITNNLFDSIELSSISFAHIWIKLHGANAQIKLLSLITCAGRPVLEVKLFISDHFDIELRKSYGLSLSLSLRLFYLLLRNFSTLSICAYRDFLSTEYVELSHECLFMEARGNEYFTLYFARALWYLNRTWETGSKNFPHFCFSLFSHHASCIKLRVNNNVMSFT